MHRVILEWKHSREEEDVNVRAVLHIASGVHLTAESEHGCPHTKVRVGSITECEHNLHVKLERKKTVVPRVKPEFNERFGFRLARKTGEADKLLLRYGALRKIFELFLSHFEVTEGPVSSRGKARCP